MNNGYCKKRMLVMLCVSLFLASSVLMNIFGNVAQAQNGVAFTGKVRILSIQIDPAKQYILLVEMITSAASKQKEINVFIDNNTVNGLTGKKIVVKDLKAGMAVVIDGTKFVEQSGSHEISIVIATRITPLVE